MTTKIQAESINLADTFNYTGTLQQNGASIGGNNTPAFSVHLGSDQTISDNVDTKLNFNTEIFDTDNAYDTSNMRFTVPSGQAGKYQFYAQARLGSGDNNLLLSNIVIRKNGTATYELSGYWGDTNNINASPSNISTIIDLAESDYIEVYAKANTQSGSASTVDKLAYALYQTYWYGYKLL